MKTIKKIIVLFVVLCNFFTSHAQVLTSSKPYLFTGSASSVPATIQELDKAFVAKEGSSIQLSFSNFTFTGIILSSVQRYNKLSSIIIKSPSLHNTLLALSKRINDDNSITYIGRIINEAYADGYELKKISEKNYTFNKIKTEDLLQDY